jgi:hypothetical protein
MARRKYHPRLIGIGIDARVEKVTGQLPIPAPAATPRDLIVMMFYKFIKNKQQKAYNMLQNPSSTWRIPIRKSRMGTAKFFQKGPFPDGI